MKRAILALLTAGLAGVVFAGVIVRKPADKPVPTSRETAPVVDSPSGSELWTSQPKPVDRNAPQLPRIAAVPKIDPYPLILVVPETVRTSDNVTFSTPDGRYRLANVEQRQPNEICKEASGKRWACGLRLRMALRAKIAGRVFRCRMIAADSDPKAIECLDGDGPLRVDADPLRD
jgi:hypothetical protein